MSDPFLGEIRAAGFSFAPRNWATCSGQTLQISQNSALYSLLWNRYGGDGRVTFALPDLRGCCAIGQDPSAGYYVGGKGGTDYAVLSQSQIPSHRHEIMAYGAGGGDEKTAENNLLAKASREKIYNSANTPTEPMSSQMLAESGGGQAHSNQMPFQALTYIIALDGLYPSRS